MRVLRMRACERACMHAYVRASVCVCFCAVIGTVIGGGTNRHPLTVHSVERQMNWMKL